MRNDATYQRGHDWEGEDVSGCYASRKLNGVACLWDGCNAWTRAGNRIDLPKWIHRTLPAMPLDCEIIAGTGRNANFQAARAAVQFNRWTPDIHAVCHDAPQSDGDWLQRLHAVSVCGVPCVSVTVIESNADLARLWWQVSTQDGEGIVLRRPGKAYRMARTRNVLKVLPCHQVYELMDLSGAKIAA